ncbi:hypothetical protein, partial [Blautia argi]|uniref:hypothetical protein n=1 Tax=Blautia argi TaxID=1912897 RepID=UPI0029423401
FTGFVAILSPYNCQRWDYILEMHDLSTPFFKFFSKASKFLNFLIFKAILGETALRNNPAKNRRRNISISPTIFSQNSSDTGAIFSTSERNTIF